MQVTITQLIRDRDAPTLRVIFQSGIGMGTGIWMDSVPPTLGHIYDIELSIEDALEWGRNITISESPEERISFDGSQVMLQGCLEEIGPSGSAALEMAHSIVLFEAGGVPFCVGSTIQIEAQSIKLYDTRI